MKIKLPIVLVPLDKKMINNTSLKHFGVRMEPVQCKVFCSQPAYGSYMAKEEKMCLNDRREIPEFKFDQELHHGDPVKDQARKQDAEQFSSWKIFIKKDDIVPEIKVCFFMVILGKGATPYVING